MCCYLVYWLDFRFLGKLCTKIYHASKTKTHFFYVKRNKWKTVISTKPYTKFVIKSVKFSFTFLLAVQFGNPRLGFFLGGGKG